MSEPFIGQLTCVGFNYAPKGWAFCAGQIMSIAQNTALFSLLGTMYGGNGQTTFALPDLRGRGANSFGQGPGLANYTQGEMSGSETVTLVTTQLPAHNHPVHCHAGDAGSVSPTGNYPAGGTGAYNGTADAIMAQGMIAATGNSQPHNNMQPYLVLNWIIALQGIFPSRN